MQLNICHRASIVLRSESFRRRGVHFRFDIPLSAANLAVTSFPFPVKISDLKLMCLRLPIHEPILTMTLLSADVRTRTRTTRVARVQNYNQLGPKTVSNIGLAVYK